MFSFLAFIDNFFWSYIGWIAVFVVGIYLSWKSKLFQIRQIFYLFKNISDLSQDMKIKKPGVHPFKIFFASAGGMIGLGNITGISIAIMLGGPGSIFWTLIASLLGSLLKYSEIFIGMKYRIFNKTTNSFQGGPMYYLQAIFKNKAASYIFSVFLIIYGIEIYQFGVLADKLTHISNWNKNISVAILIILVLYVANGGVNRLSNIASIVMPIFFITYISIAIYITFLNRKFMIDFLYFILKSAFTGTAPIGGFAGSSVILSMYYGISKAVYSGDIGIGYDSMIQSESRISEPKKQGILAIYALFIDSAICICTNFVIGITGAWYKFNEIDASDVISVIFSEYLTGYSQIFLNILFFIAGFTTIVAFINAGIKAAEFIFPKIGKILYNFLAVVVFWIFSHFSQEKTMLVMSIISGFLMIINIYAILMLRKEIKFDEE